MYCSYKQSHNSDTEINTLFVTFIFLSIICIKECVVGFNSQIQNRCYLSAALIILLLPARGYFGLKAVAVLPAFNPKILQWLPAAASDSHATESINIKQESKKKSYQYIHKVHSCQGFTLTFFATSAHGSNSTHQGNCSKTQQQSHRSLGQNRNFGSMERNKHTSKTKPK